MTVTVENEALSHVSMVVTTVTVGLKKNFMYARLEIITVGKIKLLQGL